MEIAAQSESRGIIYEGYTDAFKQCVFEDGAIQGRNERYEFRCDANLECCGRTCCIPQDATVPLWLVILFIILGLLLLMALAALLAYLYSKRKPKPKKEKFVPSPLEETLIAKPQPVKIVQHNEDEISRASVPETVSMNPPPMQKAQHAFYRSQVDIVPSYNPVD
uniref:CX domain-containing protein n=1 Tax=Panagrolaimus sp. JU765 TaxID=591449 RepID=A0AC34QTH6_9BILA